jgi:peptidoglycan/LPS O-acetylase OafA/YrhL
VIPHLPALDGLRGLALLGVLLFHAQGALKGGYLGVDLFFVLSGYLITSLLLAEQRTRGRIDLGAFWVRRARRLMPALLSLMPAVALYARFFAQPSEYRSLRWDAFATLGYVANWRALFAEKSYWDLFAAPSPLEHCWSLAIEEQFYVVWPLVVWFVLRKKSPRWLLGLTLALAVASMAAMLVVFDPSKTSRAYLGTDTRAAGILMGAAFACVFPPETKVSARQARWMDFAGFGASLLLAAAWVWLDGNDPRLYRGGFWLLELATLALVGCAVAGPASLVGRALAIRPLRFFGAVSYGAYLWHWPVNVVLSPERLRLPLLGLHAVRFALTFAIAFLSHRFFEQPIRKNGVRHPRFVVPLSFAATLGGIVLATPFSAATELPKAPYLARVPDYRPDGGPPEWRLLVLGDSTANAVGWSVRHLRWVVPKERWPSITVELEGEDGFSLLADGPKWANWRTVADRVRPNLTAIVLSGAFLYGTTLDGEFRYACTPGWDERFEKALDARLASLSPGVPNVWLGTLPYALGRYDTAEFRQRIDCINASIRRVKAAFPGVHTLPLADIECPKGSCYAAFEGALIRPDGVHYDLNAARPIAERVVEALRREPFGDFKPLTSADPRP